MVVDGNDDDFEAENCRKVRENSLLVMMLMSICFCLIGIRRR
jgi:hypothetical protein